MGALFDSCKRWKNKNPMDSQAHGILIKKRIFYWQGEKLICQLLVVPERQKKAWPTLIIGCPPTQVPLI